MSNLPTLIADLALILLCAGVMTKKIMPQAKLC